MRRKKKPVLDHHACNDVPRTPWAWMSVTFHITKDKNNTLRRVRAIGVGRSVIYLIPATVPTGTSEPASRLSGLRSPTFFREVTWYRDYHLSSPEKWTHAMRSGSESCRRFGAKNQETTPTAHLASEPNNGHEHA